MFALHSRRLRRRLSVPTSGSLRRRARERRRAEQTRAEGEKIARETRERRARDHLEQQRKARQELATYQPWGRAGGGAPNARGVRYTNLRDKGIFPEDELRACQELATYQPWGRAGGGAPNARGVRYTNLRDKGIFPEDELRGVSLYEACRRWNTSPLRRQRQTPVKLREDPQLCYAEPLRKSVDNDIRYKQSPREQQNYKHILDEMVTKKKKAVREEKKKNLEYERKMQAMEGPWGKPGPGGTVWRNPRNVGLNFSKSMGWTDNEMFTKMDGDNRRNDKSSLTLPKVKGDDDFREDMPSKENVKPPNVEKLPNIKHTGRPKSPERRRFSLDVNVKHEVSYGGGGNGEGRRSPKKTRFVKRLTNGDKVTKLIIGDSYDSGETVVVAEKKPTPETTILRVTGGVELVPLLARRRRVGARTLHSSDVTRQAAQSCQWRDSLNMDYLKDLKNQMKVKCIQREEHRLNSAESVRKHHETWESLWGRQGHGAPLRGKYARNNLAQLLYVAPLTNA